jgi:hypothetical protein
LNLETAILREHSKRNTVRIAQWIGNDPKRFEELMELFLHGEHVVTQRAAWVLSEVSDNYPELITPWLGAMVKKTQEPGVHDAVKRNVVRILQTATIPRKLLGTVVTVCFDELANPESPIAVRCNAMTVLANAAEHEPDIAGELRAVIEQMQLQPGPAFSARIRHVLKQLDRIEGRSAKHKPA